MTFVHCKFAIVRPHLTTSVSIAVWENKPLSTASIQSRLAGNLLRKLPESIGQLKELTVLEVSRNDILEIPASVRRRQLARTATFGRFRSVLNIQSFN